MSDLTVTQPLWLHKLETTLAEREAEAERKAEEERVLREAKEKAEREERLKVFAASLRAVLGSEIANELLGGAEVESARAIRIQSGDIEFCYEKSKVEPLRDAFGHVLPDKKITHRIGVRRACPSEWHGGAFEYVGEIETFDEFVDGVQKLNRNWESRKLRHEELIRLEARRKADREEEERINAEERARLELEQGSTPESSEPPKPELDFAMQRLASFLGGLKETVESNRSTSAEQRLLLEIMRYLLDQHSIDW